MKEIIVTIDKDGKTTVETVGFTGSECLAATAKLESALGGKVDTKMTDEAYTLGTETASEKLRI